MSLGQGEGEKILRKKKKETEEICNQETTKIRGIQGILPKTATKFIHCYTSLFTCIREKKQLPQSGSTFH